MRVGTVHKFQGLEFDVVIFDTVESPDICPRIDFIAGGKATEALRLINVAVTRARHKLIIVANAQHILKAHFNDKSLWFPEGSILRKAVEEARQGGAINSLDLLDLPSNHLTRHQNTFRTCISSYSVLYHQNWGNQNMEPGRSYIL